MPRYINLGDGKGKDAQVVFSGMAREPLVRQVTAEGGPVRIQRVLKGASTNAYEHLVGTLGSDEAVSNALLDTDPELSLEMTGRFVTAVSKLYVDGESRPVFRIVRRERVHLPDGTLKEEREKRESPSNVHSEHPLRPVGRLVPRRQAASQFVFSRKYQLSHVNGLTFDFLRGMARDLAEKDCLMMLGAGPKGDEPLVFQDGGKPYRAFLEGRVRGEAYLLLLHLSNLEVKSVVP